MKFAKPSWARVVNTSSHLDGASVFVSGIASRHISVDKSEFCFYIVELPRNLCGNNGFTHIQLIESCLEPFYTDDLSEDGRLHISEII